MIIAVEITNSTFDFVLPISFTPNYKDHEIYQKSKLNQKSNEGKI